MTDIYTYLKDYREEEPEWIGKYLRGEQITFKDIMSSKVAFYPRYYMRLNCDGTLIKVGNKSHSVHSFLYVDLIKRKELEEQIAKENSFRGYHLVKQIEWQESDIMPSGQHHILRPIPKIQEIPYCFSIIMERDENKDDTWGAEYFIVTFFFGNSMEVYNKLFGKDYLKTPWLFLVNESDRRGFFERSIQKRHSYPQFVIFDEIFDRGANIWRGYEKVNVSPVSNEYMRSLYLYSYNAVECNDKLSRLSVEADL